MKGNSDERDGTTDNIEEKGINVGSLSQDNARPQIDARKRITQRTQVRSFRAFASIKTQNTFCGIG
jgi:hypothetical protein